ncbi:MAG: hypothetical protein ACK58Q_03195 [Chitinophagales bacterium]
MRTLIFFFISLILLTYQSANSQEIKNYAEAKSVVISYLDTIKSLSINKLKNRSIRKYIVKGGNINSLNYRKKVKKIKSGLLREDISIFNNSIMIGNIILFNNEIFYASVWYKVSPTRTDILTLSKDEYLIAPFIGNNMTK